MTVHMLLSPFCYHYTMRIIHLAICLILLASLSSAVSGADSVRLLMFEQDNCAYCEKFHAEIGPAYPNTTEGKLAPLHTLMLNEPLPEELKDIEPAFVSPTFVLVENNREVDRLIGYPGDEYFWFLLGEMLEKLEQ